MSGSSENYHLFSDKSEEEMFIKRNLSFLLDSDDESQTNVRFNSREEVCTYAKSSLDSGVLETWTTLSNGSMCTPREYPSRSPTLYTIVYVPVIPGQLIQFVPMEYTREPLSYTFMGSEVQGHTSTPVRNRLEQREIPQRSRDSYVQSYANEDEVQVNSRRASVACSFAGESFPDSGYNSVDVSSNVRRDVQMETVHTSITEDRQLDITCNYCKRDLICNYCKRKLSQGTRNRNNGQLIPARSFRSVDTQTETTEVNTPDDNNKCDVCLKEATSKPLTPTDCLEKPPNKIKQAMPPARRHIANVVFCGFCFNRGEASRIYFSHFTKNQNGVVVCPILRKYVCRICGGTGDKAHTPKYCRFANSQSASNNHK